MAQQDQVAENPKLSAEQIAQVQENYEAARKFMLAADQNLETALRLKRELEASPQTLEQISGEIEDASNSLEVGEEDNSGNLTEGRLFNLEQTLLRKDGSLRAKRAEMAGFETSIQSLLQRPVLEELFEARVQLAEVIAELETLSENEIDPVSNVRRILLQSREYFHRTQIAVFEQEIAGLSIRQQILGSQMELAALQAQSLEEQVINLQRVTGGRRLLEAQAVSRETMETIGLIEDAHPFLIDYAARNVSLSKTLENIARQTAEGPKKQAEARANKDNVKNDLSVARQLTKLGQVDRQSSVTLRRLRNQGVSMRRIKSDIKDTQRRIVLSTQEQLRAQEQLRNFPVWQFDVEKIMAEWQSENPAIRDLSPTELDVLRLLYDTRKDVLERITDEVFDQITIDEQLESLQAEHLTHTEDLRDLLDQKLLWLPSVTAIDGGWPARVWRGAGEIFSFEKFIRAGRVLKGKAQSHWLLILVFLIAIFAAINFRSFLRQDIATRAKDVGHLENDSYLHTPFAIAAGGIIAAPIPLVLLLLGILFASANYGDTFIVTMGQMCISLSGFTWFFMTWREWTRDKALLDDHFGLPLIIRRKLSKLLGWFIPFAGVTIALVTLTQNSHEPDIYEGFSLLAFILTALALSLFSFKLLWQDWAEAEKALFEKGHVWRHRRSITFIIVGLPLVAAVLAGAGYYDTARELLSRLFISAGLVVATYITFGLIRRTVLIAQRKLALREHIERREMERQALKVKEEAEERGETSPVPLDYDEIDIETLSRQSSQLLSAIMISAFAIVMWFFWKDLLPALSVFDDVAIWRHTVTEIQGEVVTNVTESVTLWNLIQALAIVVLTFIAARNLPGFLEVFILKRSRFDRGTRYAIVSVLGYAIVAIGLVLGFNKLGIQWSELQWIIAALGVGIGFGLQEIIANFISGLILLFERPVRIGDYVTIGDQSGTVSRIQIRATTLSDLDNREILIPNKSLVTEKVVNWTLSNSVTRLIIRVGVAYGSDTEAARKIMLGVIGKHPKILDKPNPQALFLGFGESSLDFEIRVFLKAFEDRFPVSHALHTDINKALDKAGISIPFPQRDLHVITQPEKA